RDTETRREITKCDGGPILDWSYRLLLSVSVPLWLICLSTLDRARLVGGSSLAQGQLDFASAFVQRPEFLAKYPANLDGSSFIDAVLNTIKNTWASIWRRKNQRC